MKTVFDELNVMAVCAAFEVWFLGAWLVTPFVFVATQPGYAAEPQLWWRLWYLVDFVLIMLFSCLTLSENDFQAAHSNLYQSRPKNNVDTNDDNLDCVPIWVANLVANGRAQLPPICL